MFPLTPERSVSQEIDQWYRDSTYALIAVSLAVAILGGLMVDSQGRKVDPQQPPTPTSQPSLVSPEVKVDSAEESRKKLINRTVQQTTQSDPNLMRVVAAKWWRVIPLENPIKRMWVTTKEGILYRRIPDRVVSSNTVPTLAPGDQPQIRAFYAGADVRVEIKDLILEEDEWKRRVVFAVVPVPDGSRVEVWPLFDSSDPENNGSYVDVDTSEGREPIGQIVDKFSGHYPAFTASGTPPNKDAGSR